MQIAHRVSKKSSVLRHRGCLSVKQLFCFKTNALSTGRLPNCMHNEENNQLDTSRVDNNYGPFFNPWLSYNCSQMTQIRRFNSYIHSHKLLNNRTNACYHSSSLSWQQMGKNIVNLEEKTQQLLKVMRSIDNKDLKLCEERSKTSLSQVLNLMGEWSEVSEGQDGMFKANQTESLLKALETNYDENVEKILSKQASQSDKIVSWTLTPNAVSYNMVCHAYAISGGGEGAAIRAQSILERMLRRCEDYCLYDHTEMKNQRISIQLPPEPTDITFNTVINAWSKSNHVDSGKKAEEVYKMMEIWLNKCKMKEKEFLNNQTNQFMYKGSYPNVRTVSCVIDAWANSKSKSATERVMAMIELIVDKNSPDESSKETKSTYNDTILGTHQESTFSVKPNVIIFNSVINAVAKSGHGRIGAEKAEEVLRWMEEIENSKSRSCEDSATGDDASIRPNTRTYSLVIEAWANAVEDEGEYAAERAQTILKKMETLYEKGEDVKPNVISYTSCMTAWARCKGSDKASDNVEYLLEKLLEMHDISKDEALRPNTTTFNACMSVHARSRDPSATSRAEKILDKMEEFGTSDTTSYNTILNAYSKSDDRNKTVKAMSLFSRMETKGIHADSITYNTIIDVFARSRDRDAASKANDFLQKMINLSESENSPVNPSLISFTSTLNAFSKSSDPLAVDKSMKIFDQLIDMYEAGNKKLKPDVYVFSTFINICANCNGNRCQKRDALKYAIKAFEQLQRSDSFGSPNQYIYGSLIKACSRLSSSVEERGRLLKSIFFQAQKDGEVSIAVLRQFERNAPLKVKRQLLKDCSRKVIGKNESYDVPSEWCRNVRKKDRP